ncbi:MAG: FecR domain-containing protein [Spirochaetes bacterium]|nr:FecR domain-containing protein [Spirochaetota bacterium]
MIFHRVTYIHTGHAAAMAAIVAISCTIAACKPVNESRAIAAFVVGEVTLERPSEPARQVRHKDEIRKGDLVKTGAASLLVLQIGRDSLIKLEADTTLSITSLFERGSTKFALEQGTLFARARKLLKSESFQVQTMTSLAAVRGTQFSVSYGKGESVVAVNSGEVAVQKVADDGTVKDETTVGKGNAAVVNKKISTRPVSPEERAELARFEKIEPVKDIDSATEADLRKLEESLMKGAAESDVENSNPDPKKDVTTSEKEKSVEDDEVKNMVIWTGKQVYSRSDTIVVNYKNVPDYRNCWIDISKAADPDGSYQSYNWTYAAKEGQMTFPDMNLEPGLYEVRVHLGRGSSVSKRFRFRVQ